MQINTGRYIGTMMLASAITLIRGFAVAAILHQAAFGIYATTVAAGLFASSLLSFGLIERTFKVYPRLLAEYRGMEALTNGGVVSLKLILRFFFLLPLTILSAHLIGLGIVVGASVACVALSTAILSLYASLLRATTDIHSLSVATLYRALSAIGFAVGGAWALGWPGAILGEISAGIIGVFLSRYYVRRIVRLASKRKGLSTPSDASGQHSDAKGLWVFFGFLAVAVPGYLDRSFIAATFDAASAGTYAFLLLFVVGANTVVGILVQKAGPTLIHMERSGMTVSQQLRYALRWLSLFWAAWLVGVVLIAVALLGTPLASFAQKYQITFSMLPAVWAMGCLQVTAILDFILLSRDRETALFASSFSYLVVTILICGITFWFRLSLLEFIWLLTAAKLFHFSAQAGAIWSIVAPTMVKDRRLKS